MSKSSEGQFDRIGALDPMVVIETLANSIDPVTGDVFPEESPYNHPAIIRALFTSLRAMQRLRKRESRQRGGRRREGWERCLPENAGKSCGEEEDQRLIAEFDNGAPLQAIAVTHGRTEGAIAARLVRVGRISERSEARQSDRTRRG